MSKDYAIGVDIGVTNTRVALGDSKGNILEKLEEKTEKENREAISKQILRMISSLKNTEKVRGIGIGAKGSLNPEKGEIVNMPDMPFKNIPLVKPISAKTKLPIRLLNECNAAVLAEHELGEGRNIGNLVYITISSGIGGGVLVDNHLLLGKNWSAGEIGHITIDLEGRLKCGCGKYGHWEAYCSGNHIPDFARLWLSKVNPKELKKSLLYEHIKNTNLTTETIFNIAKSGDKLSLLFIDEIGRLNAMGFANVINAYDPSLIAVGGAVALNNPDLILNPIKKYVHDYTINRIPKIKLTSLGDDIVLYGALTAVFDRVGFPGE